MIKPRDAEVGHVKIRPAIVIVITNRDAHPPALVGHAGFIGDVFELPVTQVSIQRRARWLFFSLQGRQSRAVYQIDIRQTISVVIKDRHTARWYFENIILRRRTGQMLEVCQSGLFGGVFKDHGCFGVRDPRRPL